MNELKNEVNPGCLLIDLRELDLLEPLENLRVIYEDELSIILAPLDVITDTSAPTRKITQWKHAIHVKRRKESDNIVFFGGLSLLFSQSSAERRDYFTSKR